MNHHDFSAVSGGRSFSQWLHDIRSLPKPVAFLCEQELAQLSIAMSNSLWLTTHIAEVEAEARSYLNLPVELADLVDGHGHQFFCGDGTFLMPLPDNAGGKCLKCDSEYTTEPYKHGAAYARQFDIIRRALAMSAAYCVGHDPVFALATMEVLKQFASLYSRHGQLVKQTLDEAWRITALAYAYRLVAYAPGVEPEQRQHIEASLFRAAAHRLWRGYDLLGNWGACHDLGLGIVGLVLRDEHFLRIALDGFLRRAHAYFREDGVGVEGSIGTYHNMTLQNMVSLAEALLPTGINLYEARFRRAGHERIIEKLLDAQMKLAYPDTRLPALHDGWYNGNCCLCPDLYEIAFRRYQKLEYRQAADAFYATEGALGETYAAPVKRSRYGVMPVTAQVLPSYPIVWDYYVRSLYPSADEWFSHPQSLYPPPDFWQAHQTTLSSSCNRQPASNLFRESSHFSDAGFIVLRSASTDTYMLCDYGPHGGGHGHPDKLNIVMYSHGRVLVPDYGTSAYGLPIAAQWYRRTLSHNTIMADGVDQVASQGELYALELGGACQRVHVAANHIYAGVCMERRIVLTQGLVLMLDTVESNEIHTYDWLLHARGELALSGQLKPLEQERQMDYTFLSDPRWFVFESRQGRLSWQRNDGVGLDLLWQVSAPVKLLTASGPGALMEQLDPMISLRTSAKKVSYAALLAPIVDRLHVEAFAVAGDEAGGSWCYQVRMSDGKLISGCFN